MTFNIAEIAVTHTYYYSSSEYLTYVEELDGTPSEHGFFEYILADVRDDFPKSDWHPYRVIGNDAPEVRTDDASALDVIAARMSGVEWDSDCINAIAEIVQSTGRKIADLDCP